MIAKNIHKTALNLESGIVRPGKTAEFTGTEFMFLAKMGRAETNEDTDKLQAKADADADAKTKAETKKSSTD